MESAKRTDFAKRLVILVDDDPSFAKEVKAFLGQEYRVAWANRSGQGLELILRHRPLSILLDLNLPHHFSALDEDEGLELLTRLPDAMRKKVVVVTAALSALMRARLASLGVRRVHLKSEPLLALRDVLAGSEP
jgi:DNA-binding NarL/FixJ family response regulator